jgi:hypothetical protein
VSLYVRVEYPPDYNEERLRKSVHAQPVDHSRGSLETSLLCSDTAGISRFTQAVLSQIGAVQGGVATFVSRPRDPAHGLVLAARRAGGAALERARSASRKQ